MELDDLAVEEASIVAGHLSHTLNPGLPGRESKESNVTKPSEKEITEALLERHGRTFTQGLGITFEKLVEQEIKLLKA